jgi:hypothetical protein
LALNHRRWRIGHDARPLHASVERLLAFGAAREGVCVEVQQKASARNRSAPLVATFAVALALGLRNRLGGSLVCRDDQRRQCDTGECGRLREDRPPPGVDTSMEVDNHGDRRERPDER